MTSFYILNSRFVVNFLSNNDLAHIQKYKCAEQTICRQVWRICGNTALKHSIQMAICLIRDIGLAKVLQRVDNSNDDSRMPTWYRHLFKWWHYDVVIASKRRYFCLIRCECCLVLVREFRSHSYFIHIIIICSQPYSFTCLVYSYQEREKFS